MSALNPEERADDWVSAASDAPPPALYRDVANNTWVLHQDVVYSVTGAALLIPAGFVFDLASIPRLLWWVPGYAPFELGTTAPLVHDYLYRYRGSVPPTNIVPYREFTRRQADRYFLDEMERTGVGAARRRIVWLAVRAFGRLAW